MEDRIAFPCVSHPFHCLGSPVAAFKAATGVAVSVLFCVSSTRVVFSFVLFLLHRHVLGRSLEHPHARIHSITRPWYTIRSRRTRLLEDQLHVQLGRADAGSWQMADR